MAIIEELIQTLEAEAAKYEVDAAEYEQTAQGFLKEAEVRRAKAADTRQTIATLQTLGVSNG